MYSTLLGERKREMSMARPYETRLRKVKKGETVEYDCGCTYVIDGVDDKGIPIDVSPDFWCDEHDPTLWGNGKKRY
jgi:hypothetical protein